MQSVISLIECSIQIESLRSKYNKLIMQEENKFNSPTKSIQTISNCSDLELQLNQFQSLSEEVFPAKILKPNSSQKKSQQNLIQQFQKRKWSTEDQELLINLHKKMGNKWTLLTQYYPGTSQNFIKNHFYSRLRKSIRKLNKYIGMLYNKKYSKFKLNIIFKLSNISEGKISQKQRIAPQIFQFYKNFLYQLIQFSDCQKFQDKNYKVSQEQRIKIQSLILSLTALENLFRLVRGQRTAKGKKKNIAYLRQFKFRLSLQYFTQIVITKQNIYMQENQKTNRVVQNFNSQNFFEGLQARKTRNQKNSQYCCSSRQNTRKKQSTQNLRSSSQLKQEPFFSRQTLSLQKAKDFLEEKAESQIWRDYFGCQLKEYDMYFQNDQIPISLKNLTTFKILDFLEQSSDW